MYTTNPGGNSNSTQLIIIIIIQLQLLCAVRINYIKVMQTF